MTASDFQPAVIAAAATQGLTTTTTNLLLCNAQFDPDTQGWQRQKLPITITLSLFSLSPCARQKTWSCFDAHPGCLLPTVVVSTVIPFEPNQARYVALR